MDRTAWLESLKVGDRVAVMYRSVSDTVRFRTVTRATATRITTDDGARFDRRSGSSIPFEMGGPRLEEPTPQLETAVERERLLQHAEVVFSPERLRDMPRTMLLRILTLVAPHTALAPFGSLHPIVQAALRAYVEHMNVGTVADEADLLTGDGLYRFLRAEFDACVWPSMTPNEAEEAVARVLDRASASLDAARRGALDGLERYYAPRARVASV